MDEPGSVLSFPYRNSSNIRAFPHQSAKATAHLTDTYTV